jgi:hypothetical protein
LNIVPGLARPGFCICRLPCAGHQGLSREIIARLYQMRRREGRQCAIYGPLQTHTTEKNMSLKPIGSSTQPQIPTTNPSDEQKVKRGGKFSRIRNLFSNSAKRAKASDRAKNKLQNDGGTPASRAEQKSKQLRNVVQQISEENGISFNNAYNAVTRANIGPVTWETVLSTENIQRIRDEATVMISEQYDEKPPSKETIARRAWRYSKQSSKVNHSLSGASNISGVRYISEFSVKFLEHIDWKKEAEEAVNKALNQGIPKSLVDIICRHALNGKEFFDQDSLDSFNSQIALVDTAALNIK